MLTITWCVQQRLFEKRKKLRNTVIKQGSENGININPLMPGGNKKVTRS